MLFKILHGDKSNISTDITPFHEGYCYVTHQGYMYVDINIGTKDTPNNQRIKLNAQNCETLMGISLDELRNEISTQDAVVLSEAQSYADNAIEVVKNDIATQQAVILHEAQSYTDHAFEAATTQDAVILAEAQAYTDEALAKAQLSVDDAPTEGSTNPVSSGGVYTELSNVAYINSTDNENITEIEDNGVVMYSVPQILTDYEKAQACQNIGIPVVTTADAGKFVRVSSEGKWIVESIPNAEEVAF